MHWAAHVPSAGAQENAQDLRKINKLASKYGVANAKHLADFRKHTDVKLIHPGPAGSMPKVYRQSSRNPVLVQDDVGKAKPSCYDLPHEGHAYGRSEQRA